MNERTPLRFRSVAASAKSDDAAVTSYNSVDTGEISSSALNGPGVEASTPRNADEEENGKKKSKDRCGCCQVSLLDGVAAVGVSSSLIAIHGTETPISILASTFTMIMSPYVAYQKRKLNRLSSLRRLHNRLRHDVNALTKANSLLRRNVMGLEGSVTRLEEVEIEIERLVDGDRGKVQRLVEVVEAQKEVYDQMKQQLKAQVIQNVIGVVTRSDTNTDFQLSPTEIESLIVRLGMMDGVHFHEKRFRRKLASNPNNSMHVIMDIIRSLMASGDGSDEKGHSNGEKDDVFTFFPEEV